MTGRSEGGQVPGIGVEEEFLLVDAATGRPAPRIAEVIGDAEAVAGDAAQTELHQAQIETATEVCRSLEQVRESLVRLRNGMADAAARHGTRVVASGTFPGTLVPEGRLITGKERYERMAAANALIADEQLICGCHVHISVDGPEQAVAVANRIRRWLPVLLALSANSPFWDGQDSGYSSYRTEIWSRWPTSGPPGEFRDADEYWAVVDSLVRAGVILDRGMAYWDVRPSRNYPTVEVRVADVAMTPDDAVVLAGLTRALVLHCQAAAGPVPPLRQELLRAATWMAARGGLTANLMDPADGSVQPAARAVGGLLEMLSEPLERLGDREQLTESCRRILTDGNGADRQRAAYRRAGSLGPVIDLAAV